MGPSKILTVSYGTFSCTLEGFDDPFSTMRGIAEYFRDLAAEDRYFGAEPPTPDAEMLHRIAEREVHRRVEAHVGDNSIVLRQMEGESRPDDNAPEAPEVAPKGPPQAEPETRAQDNAPQATASAAAIIAATQAPAAESAAQPATEPAQDMTGEEAPVKETEPKAEPAPAETVAERLARIRAVVSDGESYQEDEADEVFSTAPISAAFDDVEDIHDRFKPVAETSEAAQQPADEPEVAQEPTEAEQDAALDNLVAAVSADNGEDALDEAFEAEFDASDETKLVADEAPAVARVIKMRREDFENAMENGALEGAEPETMPDEQATIAAPIEAEFEAEIEVEVEIADESDADLDLEAEAHDMTQAPGADAKTLNADAEESSLSPEDEAELMATLEAVQRKADAEARAEREGRAMLETQDIEANAESVSRILDVTNTEMEETEGTRRRSAIAHLKAAVAATRADKFLSRAKDEEAKSELTKYRTDLEKVVRPRRPSESEMPKKRRTVPLVLVSEQRVDKDAGNNAPAHDGPAVRPRRISTEALNYGDDVEGQDDAQADNIFVDPGSFAQFAAEMGAHDLPDLLEAAAAYTSFVEGNAFFSRPQIMNAVAQLNEDKPYSREESLRSFGLLLRRGKIKKIKRGQFVISDNSRFKPQQAAVGE